MKQKSIDIHRNNGRASPGTISSTSAYIKSLLNHPNAEKALGNISEQAGLNFDSRNKVEIEILELQVKDLELQYQQSFVDLKKFQIKKTKFRPYIRSKTDKSKVIKTPFNSWSTGDQCSFLIFTCATVVMFATGFANVFSNIMSTGNPVFLERPHLALLLSFLFPAGAFSLKSFRDTLEEDFSRLRYTRFIYIATFSSIAFWIFQFSLHFPGIASDFDLDNLDVPGESNSIMVLAQLIAEFFVSVTLHFTAADIPYDYSRPVRIPNPQHIEIVDILKNHRHEHEQLTKELGEKRGRLKELNAMRQAFIKDLVGKFTNQRIRFDNSLLNSELDFK